jgi:hypothetical protein
VIPCDSLLRNHFKPGVELRDNPFVGRSVTLAAAGSALYRISPSMVDGLLRSLMDLCELADGDQVVRRRIEDAEKLGTRLIQARV